MAEEHDADEHPQAQSSRRGAAHSPLELRRRALALLLAVREVIATQSPQQGWYPEQQSCEDLQAQALA